MSLIVKNYIFYGEPTESNLNEYLRIAEIYSQQGLIPANLLEKITVRATKYYEDHKEDKEDE